MTHNIIAGRIISTPFSIVREDKPFAPFQNCLRQNSTEQVAENITLFIILGRPHDKSNSLYPKLIIDGTPQYVIDPSGGLTFDLTAKELMPYKERAKSAIGELLGADSPDVAARLSRFFKLSAEDVKQFSPKVLKTLENRLDLLSTLGYRNTLEGKLVLDSINGIAVGFHISATQIKDAVELTNRKYEALLSLSRGTG